MAQTTIQASPVLKEDYSFLKKKKRPRRKKRAPQTSQRLDRSNSGR